jgi:hypothetical protein
MPVEVIRHENIVSVIEPEANILTIRGAFNPNYGSFEFRGSDQTWTEISPIPLNHTNFAKHVEIDEGGQIIFRRAGKYNIAFSAQLVKLGGGTHNAEIWLQQNGEAIPHSNTVLTITGGNNAALVAAWNFFVDVDADDYVQLYWWVDAINSIKIDSRAAISGRPEVPGVILTVNQVA